MCEARAVLPVFLQTQALFIDTREQVLFPFNNISTNFPPFLLALNVKIPTRVFRREYHTWHFILNTSSKILKEKVDALSRSKVRKIANNVIDNK